MSDTKTIPSYKENLSGLIEQLGGMLPADKLELFNKDAKRLAEKYSSPLKLAKGDKAPSFTLPNAHGEEVSLEGLLEKGAVVVTFYRGVWCPYCNLELKTYQEILPQIKKAGASLVVISPMTPDNSVQMIDANELQFEVLSDVGNKVTRQFTTVFKNADTSIQTMSELGYDFHSFYEDTSAELPVPASFVIAQDGTIAFAGSGGGDYRERVEPASILTILEQI